MPMIAYLIRRILAAMESGAALSTPSETPVASAPEPGESDAHEAGSANIVGESVADVVEQAVVHEQAIPVEPVVAAVHYQGLPGHEVTVAGSDHESVDVLAKIGKLQRVNHEANVCAVLPGPSRRRHVKELHPVLVKVLRGAREAAPITIGAPEEDLALVEQNVERRLDVIVLSRDPGSCHEVLEVDEQGDSLAFGVA